MFRNTYVQIDTNKIQNNVKKIINKYNNYKYYIGVVKGNAYGHGYYISKYLIESGINYLAVSSLQEAIEVRKYVDTPILCLEPINLDYIDIASKNNVTITISSYEYYKKLIKNQNLKIKVHIKINTGLNRLGLDNKLQINEIYNNLINNKNIELEGIFTHFATTGIIDKNYDNQLSNFIKLTEEIDLTKIKIVHLSRSSTLQSHPKIAFETGVRLGICMYGIGQKEIDYRGLKGKLRKLKHLYIIRKKNISKSIKSDYLELQTGFCLKSSVIEINKIKQGESVGYEATYTANKDTIVAVCEIGYSDGLSLKYKYSKVSINNKLYPIIGVINMCMIMVEVDDSVNLNDQVTVLGNEIDIRKTSKTLGITPYAAMTMINPLLPRIYLKNNKIEKIVEYERN